MNSHNDKRRSQRTAYNKEVEFIVDDEIIPATAIDVSDNGIRFKTEFPVNFVLRIKESDGTVINRAAKLTWAKGSDGTGMEYGFEYTDI